MANKSSKIIKIKTSKSTTKKNTSKTKKSGYTAMKKVRPPRIKEKYVAPSNISEELVKVTNVKSREQIKAPKSMALLILAYVSVLFFVLIFVIIKFVKPQDRFVVRIEKKDVQSSKNIGNDILSSIDILESIEDESIESEQEIESTTEITETTKEETEKKETEKKETEKKETEKKETVKKETVKKETVKKETVKKETTSKEVSEESFSRPVQRPFRLDRTSVTGLLPYYESVLYSVADAYQFSLDELGVIYKELYAKHQNTNLKIFGTNVSLEDKAKDGVGYLNYDTVRRYMTSYNESFKWNYEKLPLAPYYNYVTDDKFGYDEATRTNKLKYTIDFTKAQDKNIYYEMPAVFIEPDGKTRASNIRILKNAKVGFCENFNLCAMLEILDIEFNVNNNPYFDIDDVIGQNPKAVADFGGSDFKIQDMLKYGKFNYVILDKKGYVTNLFFISKS